jgi:hypothetical protein
MGSRAGALYWMATGAVIGFGLIGLMTIGFPYLVAGLVMALVGLWRPGRGGAWSLLLGIGGLPALVFLSHLVRGLLTALNPYCGEPGPGAPMPPPPGPVGCAFVPGSYYVKFATFTAVALAGVALGLLMRARSRPSAT